MEQNKTSCYCKLCKGYLQRGDCYQGEPMLARVMIRNLEDRLFYLRRAAEKKDNQIEALEEEVKRLESTSKGHSQPVEGVPLFRVIS